ncbi:hypothetical protein IGI39_001426 [Enterococcus sp. AZ135]|uniref:ROK family protein n=1 Tax=unclassified Enterococcus TaxID=2608891 RepID=UPI003F26C54A
MCVLVIDIGGSSVKSGLFEKGQIIDVKMFSSPSSWQKMTKKLDDLVAYYKHKYKLEAISFSVPGIADQGSGEIKGASSLSYIHGFNFKKYFEIKYELTIYFENDANCACLAELKHGNAQGVESALFVVIGTGIGGAIFMGGQVHSGFHGFSGEFGMMLMDKNKEWSELGSAVHMSRKFSKFKERKFTGKEIFELAEQKKDREAIKFCNELYHYLALGIYNLQYILDPQCIIVSGGISGNLNLINNIEKELDKIMDYGQRCPIKPKIIKARYGNNANLLGAGLLATLPKNEIGVN